MNLSVYDVSPLSYWAAQDVAKCLKCNVIDYTFLSIILHDCDSVQIDDVKMSNNPPFNERSLSVCHHFYCISAK